MAASATDNGRISYPAIIPMGLEESVEIYRLCL